MLQVLNPLNIFVFCINASIFYLLSANYWQIHQYSISYIIQFHFFPPHIVQWCVPCQNPNVKCNSLPKQIYSKLHSNHKWEQAQSKKKEVIEVVLFIPSFQEAIELCCEDTGLTQGISSKLLIVTL